MLRKQPEILEHFRLDRAEGLEFAADRVVHRFTWRKLFFRAIDPARIRLASIEFI